MSEFLNFEEPAALYQTSNIILEVKAKPNVIDTHFKQTLNYLAASKIKLALIINFGENSLKFKRIVL